MAQEPLKLMVEQMALFMAPTRTHSRHKEPPERQKLGQSWVPSAHQALAAPASDKLPTCITQRAVRKSRGRLSWQRGEGQVCGLSWASLASEASRTSTWCLNASSSPGTSVQ